MNFDFDIIKNLATPNISNIVNSLPRISPITETLEKGNLIREIDGLNYQVEWLNIQKKDYADRLKSIDKGNDVKLGLIISMAIVIFDIVIPFLFIIFSSFFDNSFGKTFLLVYLIVFFILSITSIFIYLAYSFKDKTQKKDN